MYICMYICMYVCMYVCIFVCAVCAVCGCELLAQGLLVNLQISYSPICFSPVFSAKTSEKEVFPVPGVPVTRILGRRGPVSAAVNSI